MHTSHPDVYQPSLFEAFDDPAPAMPEPILAEAYVPGASLTYAVSLDEYAYNKIFLLESISKNNRTAGRRSGSHADIQQRYTPAQLAVIESKEDARLANFAEDEVRAAFHIIGAAAMKATGCYPLDSLGKPISAKALAAEYLQNLYSTYGGTGRVARARQAEITRLRAGIAARSKRKNAA
ncbi:MAG TPA: hypothetical protein VFT53_06850 [Candidatus Saccharimonadales bacterium]|nr:hypothetical protein [Candidatus Saccharimonadales bacterium]